MAGASALARAARWLRPASALLWILPGLVSADEVRFVYIPGNTGVGSGGHGAIAIQDQVFHAQNRGDGLVYFLRDRWTHFEHVYTGLKNRPLHVAHLSVEPADRERLADQLSRVWVSQQLALAERDARRADVADLEALTRTPGPLQLEIPGAGLVDPSVDPTHTARALRERLIERMGHDQLRVALEAVERAAAHLELPQGESDLGALRDRLALREALRAALGAWPLAETALVEPVAGHDPLLTASERLGLVAYREHFLESWTELLASRRADRGRSLLLAWARALAVERSLAENRMRLLDPLPEPLEPGAGLRSVAAESRARWVSQTGEILHEARPVVLDPASVDPARFNQLETIAAVLARFASGSEDGAIHDLERQQSPMRSRRVEVASLAGDLPASLERARRNLARSEASLVERYGYDIVRRNCITELERATLDAFGSREAARSALGGIVPQDEWLAFIPFVFFGRVVERLHVVEVTEIPSYRIRRLSEIAGRWARLRESFAPLSTLYQPRPRDGHFLLFTDDVLWRRPLYGAANFIWGALHLFPGTAYLPFDSGARFRASVSGMFWSLPELAFVNVRKGTFDWVEPTPDSP